MEKSSSTFITKKAQIFILLFCIVSTIAFILFYQLLLTRNQRETTLLFFLGEHHKSSNPSEIINYLKWSSENACKNKVYLGGPLFEQPSHKLTPIEGQKAVCLDEKIAPKINDCLVYSFGIHDDWYFEESMEKHQGCRVYSFDHLMERGHHDHSKRIHFYPIALGSEDNAESETKDWETKTLSSIYEMLSAFHGENATIDYLKINPVEELAVLTQIIDSGFLKRVRQLSLKIVVPSKMKANQEYLNEIEKVLQRIDNEGEMVRFSSRVNYFSNRKVNGNMRSYSAYELVWFNFGKLKGRDDYLRYFESSSSVNLPVKSRRFI